LIFLNFALNSESFNAVCAKLHLGHLAVNHDRNLLKIWFKCAESLLGPFSPPFSGNTAPMSALTPVNRVLTTIVANECHESLIILYN